jgi:hypothetical protein
LGRLRRLLLGISSSEVTFQRRGFHPGERDRRERLEGIGRTFLDGYHAALLESDLLHLGRHLDAIAPERRGFAYEGAAMGLALRDALSPVGRNLFDEFVRGVGREHAYTAHVGLGWALARLPRWLGRSPAGLDPLLRWLVFDGYGFHEGYFHGNRSYRERSVPDGLHGYERCTFDQGLGRCLWFWACADTDRIPGIIRSFPPTRHADLWSGVGLACTYAGGANRPDLERLAAAGAEFAPHLGQGAVFAAKAHRRAGGDPEHAAVATEVLCGLSPAAAAAVSDESERDLPPDAEVPAYEIWRRRIRDELAGRPAARDGDDRAVSSERVGDGGASAGVPPSASKEAPR